MGKHDTAIKKWLSDKRRFADLFNGILFEGKQIICPADLESAESESTVLFAEKNGKDKSLKRYRDIVMRWKKEIEFVILAVENQERIHYAMPVRNMLYDSISYTEQIEGVWKIHKNNGEKFSDAEFLSHFRKDDSIYPVITIVFYYGDKPWDGSNDIYGMFPGDMSILQWEVLEKYVSNYRVNLIDLNNIEHLERFQTDLQVIFGMVKYKREKKNLLDYVEKYRGFFQGVDRDTYYALGALLDSQSLLKIISEGKIEKEGQNMCEALQELYEDGVELGIEQGKLNLLFELVREDGYPIEKAAEKASLSVEEFRTRMLTGGSEERKIKCLFP